MLAKAAFLLSLSATALQFGRLVSTLRVSPSRIPASAGLRTSRKEVSRLRRMYRKAVLAMEALFSQPDGE
jgi:hypothetical protein